MPTDTTITRYGSTGANQGFAIVVRPDGPWVRYEDHERALTAARDAAERDAPEIQVGDWVLTRFFGNTLIRVSSAQVLDALDRGALLEARGERNGQPFIWRRRQEGQ